jgi:hypothetical protein
VSLEGVYDVTVTLTNEGQMPTALDIARRVKIVRPDTCTLTPGSGQELLKAPQGQRQQRPVMELGWLKAGETKTVTWQVKGIGKAIVNLSSTRGGIDRKDVTVGPPGTAGGAAGH